MRSRSIIDRLCQPILSFVLVPTTLSTFVTVGACTGIPGQPAFHEEQLIHIPSQQPIAYQTLAQELVGADVIYLGEEHYTPSHIQAALHVLTTLVEAGTHPALGLEMLSWDGQPAIDRFIRGEIATEDEFLREVHWHENWGGDYHAYAPLINFARRHRIPVYGLNPPRSLVRLVAKRGLDTALRDPAMNQWGIEALQREDPEYRNIIFEQIRACHPNLSQEVYERIFEASIFRDEGMASVITKYLRQRTAKDGPFVSYTGSGHIQFGVPVPKRVKRNWDAPLVDLTIYLMTFDPSRTADIREAIQERIADYLWLTTPGPRGIQQRCG